MSGGHTFLGLDRVANERVWRQTRALFLAAAVFFLVTISFGLLNAVTTGSLPRWQLLIHLHSGSIGWVTLSLIGIAIWLFTGQRDVSAGYERMVRLLVWISVIAFGVYIASFAIAFSQGGASFALLGTFGVISVLMIWAAAIFAVAQVRQLPLVTNIHVLVAGGLLVAAVGATMGVLLGLEYSLGRILPISGDRIGIHAAMMDAYLLLVAAAIVEWFVLQGDAGRWTPAGMAQAVAGTVAAIVVPVAFLLDLVETLILVFVLLLLLFLVIFVARMGWRAVLVNPLDHGVRAWGFFGTVWLAVFVGLFVWSLVTFQGDFSGAPEWFTPVFAHAAFVGMMTNLIFGVLSARTAATSDILAWGEPATLWVLNLGLVLFIALIVAMGTPHGAFVMGLGALLGVVTMALRLWAE